MATQQSAINKAEKLISDIQELGIHLRKAILFGSYAKNKQRRFSDIDIALVADEFTGIGFEDIQLFVTALRNNYMIQPKTYSTSYFQKGDPFIDEIKKTGIEITI
ncbi:MAG: nucleotidyltransferase domain-containing protein [Bacteroidia bacterium]|nr:nucleotidyltransferase domain-containing protein [Bacteroidia bacterium]